MSSLQILQAVRTFNLDVWETKGQNKGFYMVVSIFATEQFVLRESIFMGVDLNQAGVFLLGTMVLQKYTTPFLKMYIPCFTSLSN